MDVQGLLRNRWVWLGAAAAAGVGLVVFLARRGGSSSAGSGMSEGETAGYQPGGTGYFDSVATDFAAQLGQAEAAWQNQFDQFATDIAGQLSQLPTGGEGPGPLPPDVGTGPPVTRRRPGDPGVVHMPGTPGVPR